MRRLIYVPVLVTLVALAWPVVAHGQGGGAAGVLAEMHAAMGGADAVAAVRTLRAVGIRQQVTPRGTTEGDYVVAVELPDRYSLRVMLANRGVMSVFGHTGFDGDAPIQWYDAPPDLRTSEQGLGLRIRRAQRAAEQATADQRTEQLQQARVQFARLMLGLLGTFHEPLPLELGYGGVAESPDGTADVVEAHGPDGFEALLFIDTETHLPLMQSWTGPPRRRSRAAVASSEPVEYRIYYSNFDEVGGLTLPHTLQWAIDGSPTEEVTFETFEINVALEADTFRQR